MIETLNQFDHELMLTLNYIGTPFEDAFWYILSNKFSWVALYVTLLLTMVRTVRPQWQRLLPLLLVTVLIIVAADQISSGIIKPWVQRPRPSHEPGLMEQLHYVNGYHGGMYGFASSHAANTVALALWISLLFRRQSVWWAMGFFSLLNCYSRIYLGVHYVGDILAGLIIGLCCAWLGWEGYKRLCAKHGFEPLLYSPSLPSACPTRPSQSVALVFWASITVMALLAAVTCIK